MSREADRIRRLLRRHGLRPKKALGQHYLHDLRSLQRVVEEADLQSQEAVLEIGAGIGNLTRQLAARARMVWAIELDTRFEALLREVLAPADNVRIVMGDALALNLDGLTGGMPFVAIGNIPYQITSALIRRLLELRTPPDRIVFMLQEQVAERIVAPPGQLSLLAISVLAYGRPSLRAHVPAQAFYPAPKVDSAILRIDIHEKPPIAPAQVGLFFRVARAGFAQRRKQLKNALAGGLRQDPDQVLSWLETAGIPPRARAQELPLDRWVALTEVIAVSGPSG